MDLIKEIRELIRAIRDAQADGRITALEALQIAKELADLIRVLHEIFVGSVQPLVYRLEKEGQK